MILLTVKNAISPQWFTGVGVTFLLIHLGLMAGWTSPTLTKLMSEDSPLPLTPSQASWVGSLVNLSRFFGCIIGTFSTHHLGSKHSIFIGLFPIALGWLAIAFATSAEWLYVGRFLSGLTVGMIFSSFPLYIGEVALPRIRGSLISLASLGLPFGQFVAAACSSYLSITGSASLYFALTLPLMVLFFWLPESPHHLVKIGNHNAAINSIKWYLRGENANEELENIQNLVATNGKRSFAKKLHQLMTPPIRSATLQVIVLFAFLQFSGLNIILYFTEMILIRAKFTLIKPADLVIYINCVSIFASGASIFLIDRCGRKFLLLVSTSGLLLSMVGLMSHFICLNTNAISIDNLQWLPLFSMLLFKISLFLGVFPVPNTILGEIFPSDIKCTAACIAILVGSITAFISAKTYQPLLDLLDDVYVFMIYAIVCVFMIPYTVFHVRETKGKSLQQIQDELNSS